MGARLEDVKNGASVRGVASAQPVHVISVDWIGDQAINVVFRDHNGAVAEAVLYRDDEHRLEIEQNGRPWSFDADGALLRLVTEANRIKLAHYFDPYLAVHTSLVEPLPHQISAVYGEMLPRQPLRFLLADDPGAGKTIMAGLLMKELIARSDLERCLVVAPGSLVEQWQDELGQKFNLEFDILSRDMIEKGRRIRKLLGGGMRQAGIVAAAGLYALHNNVERLALDHENAELLATGLARLPGVRVTLPDTNIVFVDLDGHDAAQVRNGFLSHGIGVGTATGNRLRLVTHLDIDRQGVAAALSAAQALFG